MSIAGLGSNGVHVISNGVHVMRIARVMCRYGRRQGERSRARRCLHASPSVSSSARGVELLECTDGSIRCIK